MAPSFDCCIKANYHSGTPVGHEAKLGQLDAYITGAESSDKAILIIADVFGYELNNTRLLADKYAQAVGARVYIPDFFDGKSLTKSIKAHPDKDRGELVGELIKNFHPRQWERFPPVVEDIRRSQPSARKVGAVGFCWGATGCIFLGSKEAGAAQIDAVAMAHPSVIEAEDFRMLERPCLVLSCEKDGQFPKEKQEASKPVWEELAAKDVFVRQSYYPRASHGWAIKGDEEDPYSAKAMAHAAIEVISFFSLELAS